MVIAVLVVSAVPYFEDAEHLVLLDAVRNLDVMIATAGNGTMPAVAVVYGPAVFFNLEMFALVFHASFSFSISINLSM